MKSSITASLHLLQLEGTEENSVASLAATPYEVFKKAVKAWTLNHAFTAFLFARFSI